MNHFSLLAYSPQVKHMTLGKIYVRCLIYPGSVAEGHKNLLLVSYNALLTLNVH